MAIVFNDYISDGCLLGMWEITEGYDELAAMVKLSEEELEIVQNFQSYERRLEWLSVRAIVSQVLKRDVSIVYNEFRKPFLSDASYNISISHSVKLTSVMFSKKHKLGIDLEHLSNKIDRVSHKFMNDNEYVTTDPDMRLYHLYIYWCAKEALYKICDKQDINFKYNIIIEAFDPSNAGCFNAIVDNKFGKENFVVRYQKYEDYVIAWTIK